MPAEFLKAMDYALIGIRKFFCFLEVILILSKGSEEDHLNLETDCITKLDADNLLQIYQHFISLKKKFCG